MGLEIPLWAMPIATTIFTLTFFIAEHMNYSVEEWIIGNGLVAILIAMVYILYYFNQYSINDGFFLTNFFEKDK